jgi:DNA replication and repair protein RecF
MTEVRAWDDELTQAGTEVTRHREDYVAVLSRYVGAAAARLLGAEVGLELRAGWTAEHDLAAALAASWARDVERQQTHVGPHRAELLIRMNGTVARGQVSRGQQKLLAAALLLGQLQCDAERGSKLAVLTVDDPAAELDSAHLQRLLADIRMLRSQLVVTSLEPKNALLEALSPDRRFHVEHGKVARLI